MKTFIMIAGIVVCGIALWNGFALFDRVKAKARSCQQVAAALEEARKEASHLKGLPQSPAMTLAEAYTIVVNDASGLARAHRLSCAVSLDGGGADVEKAALSSEFMGLRQVAVHVVFSGIDREMQLFSLLDGLGSLEASAPGFTREVKLEKGLISVDFFVIGR